MQFRNFIREEVHRLLTEERTIDVPPVRDDDDMRPATRKQTWALYVITKKDYRDANLTFQQAKEMIEALNNESGYTKKTDDAKTKSTKNPVKGLKQYMMDNIDYLVSRLQAQMGIVGVIEDDTGSMGNKKWIVRGGGCGFAWAVFDKRSKLGKQIEEEARKIKDEVDKEVIKRGFTLQQVKEYNLRAHVFQNEMYNLAYWNLVCDYMTERGIKNARATSRAD